ncbi:MAG: hypothetical protein ACI867_001120 [Glaciecola sp.]|jgi:hypothetical protein
MGQGLVHEAGDGIDDRAMRIERLLAEVGQGEAIQRIDLVVRGDQDGHDAAAVLAVVARRFWGATIDVAGIWLQGIRSVSEVDIADAQDQGRTWRLVASATPNCAKVEPTKVPMQSPLAWNHLADVVVVHLVRGGTVTLHAPRPRHVAA